MNKKNKSQQERLDRIEREYLAPPSRADVGAMMAEFANDPDENAEFEEWIYFENGKQVTIRRQKAPRRVQDGPKNRFDRETVSE